MCQLWEVLGVKKNIDVKNWTSVATSILLQNKVLFWVKNVVLVDWSFCRQIYFQLSFAHEVGKDHPWSGEPTLSLIWKAAEVLQGQSPTKNQFLLFIIGSKSFAARQDFSSFDFRYLEPIDDFAAKEDNKQKIVFQWKHVAATIEHRGFSKSSKERYAFCCRHILIGQYAPLHACTAAGKMSSLLVTISNYHSKKFITTVNSAPTILSKK